MTIGFIGLGRMGRGMAAGGLNGGFDVVVYDPSAVAEQALTERGARRAGSVAQVAAADVILTSLPDPSEVEAVGLGEGGLLEAARPGVAWFDLSTSARELAIRLEAAFRAKGGAMLGAPVSGGPAGAATGDLVVWVGGDKTVFDRHIDVLRAFTGAPLHVGRSVRGR